MRVLGDRGTGGHPDEPLIDVAEVGGTFGIAAGPMKYLPIPRPVWSVRELGVLAALRDPPGKIRDVPADGVVHRIGGSDELAVLVVDIVARDAVGRDPLGGVGQRIVDTGAGVGDGTRLGGVTVGGETRALAQQVAKPVIPELVVYTRCTAFGACGFELPHLHEPIE